jgi:hypothetical protein
MKNWICFSLDDTSWVIDTSNRILSGDFIDWTELFNLFNECYIPTILVFSADDIEFLYTFLDIESQINSWLYKEDYFYGWLEITRFEAQIRIQDIVSLNTLKEKKTLMSQIILVNFSESWLSL